MLHRIVKLTFREEHCEEFESLFETIKERIAGQEGCQGVKLLKDYEQKGVYFTFSHWDNQQALDQYRSTDLFGEVWPKVKAWMSDKPQAWSTEELAQA